VRREIGSILSRRLVDYPVTGHLPRAAFMQPQPWPTPAALPRNDKVAVLLDKVEFVGQGNRPRESGASPPQWGPI
jgi:hypothetical protein